MSGRSSYRRRHASHDCPVHGQNPQNRQPREKSTKEAILQVCFALLCVNAILLALKDVFRSDDFVSSPVIPLQFVDGQAFYYIGLRKMGIAVRRTGHDDTTERCSMLISSEEEMNFLMAMFDSQQLVLYRSIVFNWCFFSGGSVVMIAHLLFALLLSILICFLASLE